MNLSNQVRLSVIITELYIQLFKLTVHDQCQIICNQKHDYYWLNELMLISVVPLQVSELVSGYTAAMPTIYCSWC